VLTGEGGVSIGVTAAVFDARKAKRPALSSPRCDADDDDFRGPDDVVFLPKGGMAFTVRPAVALQERRPEDRDAARAAPAGARSLGPRLRSDSFIDRLYWTLGDGTIKSLDLT
jgi:hypothetical protein